LISIFHQSVGSFIYERVKEINIVLNIRYYRRIFRSPELPELRVRLSDQQLAEDDQAVHRRLRKEEDRPAVPILVRLNIFPILYFRFSLVYFGQKIFTII